MFIRNYRREQLLHYFFLIPAMAAIANLSCLIENVRRDLRFHRLLSLFYLAIGLQNGLTALMCWGPNENWVRIFWAIQAHTFFAVAPILVAICSFASGRRLVNPWTLSVCGLALAVDLFSTSAPAFFITEFKHLEFGFAPIISVPGGIIASTVHVAAIAVSLYLLWNPRQWNAFFERKVFTIALIVWWLAIFSNFIPMSGFRFPPMHPVVDGVLSVLFAIYVNRFSAGPQGILRTLSNALISGAIGLLAALFIWPLTSRFEFGPWVLSAVSTAAGISFFSFLVWLGGRTDVPVVEVGAMDLGEYGLSKQELRICELVAEGHSRSFIRLVLNVSDGTLRNHLKNIYAKTLPENTTGSKDQLQRLTVLLSKKKVVES